MIAAVDERERLHWRRQLVLTVAGVAAGAVALALVRLSVAREASVTVAVLIDGTIIRSESYLSTMWPAALAFAILAVLGIALLVHAARVAAFTFRRGDPSHVS